MVDLTDYKQLYFQTASEHLKTLQSNFPIFMSNNSNVEVLKVLHRSAHSMKGQSVLMGHITIGALCKELEYIFRELIDKKISMSDQLGKAIADSFQNLYDSLQSIRTNDKELDLSGVKERLTQISGVKTE